MSDLKYTTTLTPRKSLDLSEMPCVVIKIIDNTTTSTTFVSGKSRFFLGFLKNKALICDMKKISLLDKVRMTAKFLDGEIGIVLDAVVDADGKDSVVRDGRYFEFSDGERVHCRFCEGESIPVMMSYEDARLDPRVFGGTAGWTKKPCASAKYMPHRIYINGVRCVRALDLTEEEAVRAGVHRSASGGYSVGGDVGGVETRWDVSFERLFNRMFKIPYRLNPWVILYDVTPVIAGGRRDG